MDFSPRIYKQILKAQDYIKKGKYQLAVDEYNKILNVFEMLSNSDLIILTE